jgi:putative tricarboxylic transport membrane protein
MSAFLDALLFVLAPYNFLLLFIGVAGGIVVGALPGLTGSVGIILLLPFLFYVEPTNALVMLSGMFCGSMYGGSISAILIGTPGTPSAAATMLDGYPLSQKGHAGKAIGVATIASTGGGLISVAILILVAPQLARFALRFGPPEYFALMIFSLTIIASVSAASLEKGLLAGFFGLLLSSVGLDPVIGASRFTFGIPRLLTGFPMLPVLIGVFAISRLLSQLEDVGKEVQLPQQKLHKVLPSWGELKSLVKVIVPTSLLGTFLGIIPGTGGAIASFWAYGEAKRFSKDPDSFGTGNIWGIAAPEAANNATTGGALVPLLTLGIPGDVVTAVILGALLVVGIRPGPMLFREQAGMMNALFVSLVFAQFLILVLGLLSVRILPKVLKTPSYILFPIILSLCFIGAFSLNNSPYDMLIALVFGVIGYFLNKHGFPPAALILGVILGPLAEGHLNRTLITTGGDWTELFRPPITTFFYVLALLSIVYALKGASAAKKRAGAKSEKTADK